MVPPTTDPSPDALLTRSDLAAALTRRGFVISRSALNRLTGLGKGPPARRWGRHMLTAWGEGLAWAEQRAATPPKPRAKRQRAAVAA